MRTTNRVERARLLLVASHYKAELGQAIKRRREELGLTQKELAELTHYKEGQTISRWERGEHLPADLEVIAAALQWTLSEMMAGITPPDKRTARRLGAVNDATPNPFPSEPTDEILRRLKAIEAKLEEVLTALQAQPNATAAIQRAFEDYASRLGPQVGKRPPRSRRATDRPREAPPGAA